MDADDEEKLLRTVALQNLQSIRRARQRAEQELLETKEALEAALEAERAARAEVERVSLMKDEFLATLSHELRTPLNAVLGWSEILLARVADDLSVRRGLETIARNARAQAQLIEDLLDMNRIISGKLRLDVHEIEVSRVVAAVLESVGPSMEGKAITVTTDVAPDAGRLVADPDRLQQILWNLMTNAVKFTPRGGSIEVTARRSAGHVAITVRDDGAGIDPAVLPHVFERFRQADSSSTRKFGGLGLGLSIVKHLVELHGGTVRAESPGLDQGAEITVCLPLWSPRAGGASPSIQDPEVRRALSTPDRSLEGLVVLVVDDEKDARELLDALLGDVGAAVITAGSAADAMRRVRAQRPDVIVSDIGMPDRDGYQFLRDLRRLAPEDGGATPAIALTAFAREEDRARATEAGYQMHLPKPVDADALVAAIRTAAGRPPHDGA